MSEATGHTMRVHVVDDDDSFRNAIGRLLSACGYAVSLYPDAQALLQRTLSDEVACVLLDVNMPGLSGLQLQAHLSQSGSALPVIFLTGHGDVAMSVRAVKAGAEDFLLKPVGRAELLDALERARLRYLSDSRRQGELAGLRRRLASLTAREREVFELVVRGLLNKQIAHQLGNTERTVKAQRHSVMDKMQAGSLAELVQAAARLGIVNQAPPD